MIVEHGFEGNGGPYYADVKTDLHEVLATKSDTMYTNSDYLDNASWDYNFGEYSAIVTNADSELNLYF